MHVFLRVEPDVLYSKQIYIILKDWQWNVLDIKYLHLHFLSYSELELPLLNVFLPGSNLLWYELFFNILVKKHHFQVKQNMSCLRMKQYRSASTSGKMGLRAQKNKMLYGKQCEKYCEMTFHIFIYYWHWQVSDRWSGWGSDLPQHLQILTSKIKKE